MSKVAKLLIASTVLACTLAVPAVAEAGDPGPPTIEVIKLVEGEVPEGTEFVVTIDCDTPQDTPNVEFTFGPEGGTQTASFSDDNRCLVTETVDGGAESVTYSAHCDGDCGVNPPAENGVDISLRQPGAEAAVLVTNTFPEAQPDDVVQEPPAADVVEVVPSFTG